MLHAEFDIMISELKELLSSVTQKKCQFCNEPIQNKKVTAEVKIPGYAGKHTKHFCSQKHLSAWRQYVKEWERGNHKVPEKGTCPTCMG